jgi:hypothetical protein
MGSCWRGEKMRAPCENCSAHNSHLKKAAEYTMLRVNGTCHKRVNFECQGRLQMHALVFKRFATTFGMEYNTRELPKSPIYIVRSGLNTGLTCRFFKSTFFLNVEQFRNNLIEKQNGDQKLAIFKKLKPLILVLFSS